MIYEIGEALRHLLEKELPLRKGDIDIQFDLPKREWSSRLNKPTLNIFLYDILENIELHASEQWRKKPNDDGTITLYRNPVRMNLFYLISCWAKDVQDEQALLSSTLSVLLREPTIPEHLLPDVLKNQPLPIRMEIAQNKGLTNLTDFWNKIDNDLHPAIRLTVTLSIDPYQPEIVAPVNLSELRFKQNPNPELSGNGSIKENQALSSSHYSVRGKIISQKYSPSALKMILTETGKEVEILEDGIFGITNLREGDYHLDILLQDRVLRHEKIQVPSTKYEITV